MDLQQTLPVQPVACGVNCGVGASEGIAAIVNMFTAARESNFEPTIVAKLNCGIPEWVDGKIVYNGTPDFMAEYAHMALNAGAKIIGGCCGTSPVHVAAMRAALDNHTAASSPTLEEIETTLGEISPGAKAQMQGDLSIAGGAAPGARTRTTRSRKRTT